MKKRMKKLKRYQIKNCKDGKYYIIDAFSKEECAEKLHTKKELIDVVGYKFHTPDTIVMYTVPFEGY